MDILVEAVNASTQTHQQSDSNSAEKAAFGETLAHVFAQFTQEVPSEALETPQSPAEEVLPEIATAESEEIELVLFIPEADIPPPQTQPESLDTQLFLEWAQVSAEETEAPIQTTPVQPEVTLSEVPETESKTHPSIPPLPSGQTEITLIPFESTIHQVQHSEESAPSPEIEPIETELVFPTPPTTPPMLSFGSIPLETAVITTPLFSQKETPEFSFATHEPFQGQRSLNESFVLSPETKAQPSSVDEFRLLNFSLEAQIQSTPSGTDKSLQPQMLSEQLGQSQRWEWAPQLSEQIKLSFHNKTKEFHLQLNPPRLGKVSVRLSQEGGQIKVQFVAETPLAKEMLEAHMPQLKHHMNLQNINVDQISVDISPQDDPSHHSNHAHHSHSKQRHLIGLDEDEDITEEITIQNPLSKQRVNYLV